MPAVPTVIVNLNDNGASAALSVPLTTIQLKIGCAVGGVVNQPFATTNPQQLQTQWIGGQLVEAGGLVCQAGNVVVGISVPIATKGVVLGGGSTALANATNVGTAAIGITLDATNGAWDNYFVKVLCVTAGTIGTAPGPSITVSLDAGRTYGTPISLSSNTSLVLGNAYSPATAGGTGIQLTFTGAQTMKVGDTWTFGTIAPQWNGAGITAALAAFQASQYGVAGVGSIHIVGDAMHNTSATATDIATIQTQLQAGVAVFEFQRAIVELRDAGAPVAYGGSAESEATWIGNLQTAVSGLTAQPRICADGGNYNTPSAFANPAGGLPAYRRNLAWSHAVRRTQIPLQRRAGRVKDGPYSNIVVNPATDPSDGFVYHDERTTPGLNTARIASAMTWPKKGAGFFQCQEPLLCTPGSQFVELAIGNVLDAACDIAYQAGVEEVSDDLLLQSNGTLDPIAANLLQGDIQTPLNEGLVQTPLVSSVTANVLRSQNVASTGQVVINISVLPRGYVNALTENISLSTGSASAQVST